MNVHCATSGATWDKYVVLQRHLILSYFLFTHSHSETREFTLAYYNASNMYSGGVSKQTEWRSIYLNLNKHESVSKHSNVCKTNTFKYIFTPHHRACTLFSTYCRLHDPWRAVARLHNYCLLIEVFSVSLKYTWIRFNTSKCQTMLLRSILKEKIGHMIYLILKTVCRATRFKMKRLKCAHLPQCFQKARSFCHSSNKKNEH